MSNACDFPDPLVDPTHEAFFLDLLAPRMERRAPFCFFEHRPHVLLRPHVDRAHAHVVGQGRVELGEQAAGVIAHLEESRRCAAHLLVERHALPRADAQIPQEDAVDDLPCEPRVRASVEEVVPSAVPVVVVEGASELFLCVQPDCAKPLSARHVDADVEHELILDLPADGHDKRLDPPCACKGVLDATDLPTWLPGRSSWHRIYEVAHLVGGHAADLRLRPELLQPCSAENRKRMVQREEPPLIAHPLHFQSLALGRSGGPDVLADEPRQLAPSVLGGLASVASRRGVLVVGDDLECGRGPQCNSTRCARSLQAHICCGARRSCQANAPTHKLRFGNANSDLCKT